MGFESLDIHTTDYYEKKEPDFGGKQDSKK